ncbi:hypothetical protein ACHAWF_002460 [Thalassiosira exigua]
MNERAFTSLQNWHDIPIRPPKWDAKTVKTLFNINKSQTRIMCSVCEPSQSIWYYKSRPSHQDIEQLWSPPNSNIPSPDSSAKYKKSRSNTARSWRETRRQHGKSTFIFLTTSFAKPLRVVSKQNNIEVVTLQSVTENDLAKEWEQSKATLKNNTRQGLCQQSR